MKKKFNYTLPLLALVIALAAFILTVYQQEVLFAIQDFTVWQNGMEFFQNLLNRPYGLLQWLSCFFTQFFYHPYSGVAILAFFWFLSGFISHKALQLPSSSSWLIPLPVFCLLIPFTQSGYWLYIVKLSAFWYLFTMLWLWWAIMLFLAFRIKKPVLKVLACILWLCILMPWNGLLVHPFDNIDEFMYLPHKILVGVLALQLLAKALEPLSIKRKWIAKTFAFSSIPIFAFAIIWSVMLNYRNPSFHSELRMQRQAESGDWNSIIQEVEESQRIPTLHMILFRDLALLHAGKLHNDSNLSCNGVRPDMLHGPKVYLAYTGGPMIYYLSGFVNDAYRWSLENSVEYGFAPQRLRIMLLCAMQNHEWDLARKYIALLRRTLFHSDFADSIEPLIGHPELFSSRPALFAISKILQTKPRLTPAYIYMEPIIFNEQYSPLKNHRKCHFQEKQTSY